MKTLYIESVGGASGDMLLGALVDCLFSLKEESGTDSLWSKFVTPIEKSLPELKITKEVITSRGLSSFRIKGQLREIGGILVEPESRHFRDIIDILEQSDFSDKVKEQSASAFERLAIIEAKAHGTSVDEVHFHEVGATDSIMDVVGFFHCLELLGVDEVVASPLRLGFGTVNTSHGILPVPVPAVSGLVTNVPVHSGDTEGELTTPTGALLITEVAASYGNMPSMVILSTGVGCGQKESTETFWNVVRMWLGDSLCSSDSEKELSAAPVEATEQRFMMEFNMDDITSERLSYLRTKLEDADARDVSFFSGVGKKGRIVHLVQVLVPEAAFDLVSKVIFKHSTTIGFRYYPVSTKCLERKIVEVKVKGHYLRIKESYYNGEIVERKVEYDDLVHLAEITGLTLDELSRLALEI